LRVIFSLCSAQYGGTIYIMIHVYDLIITCSDETPIQHVVTSLSKNNSLKYLGLLHYFLSVEVLTDADGLFLSQSKYIHDILQDRQMQDCKGIQSPMSMSETLLVDDGAPKTDGKEYRSVLGMLQYLSYTQPDITYSVNKLTQLNTLLLCFTESLLSKSCDTLKKHSNMVFVFPNRNLLLFVPMLMMIGQVTSMIFVLS